MLMKKIESVEDEIRLWFPNYESKKEISKRLSKYDKPSNFRGVTLYSISSEDIELFWKYLENTDTITKEGWNNYRKFIDEFPLIKKLQKSKWKFKDRVNFLIK